MHILLGIAGAIGLLALWYWRMKAAQDAAGDIVDAADEVRLAVRRFGYRRRTNVHPADAVEDPRLAAAGIALAVASADGPLSRAEIDAMAAAAADEFEVDHAAASEIAAFGRWVAGQCGSEEEAVRRLAKVVRQQAGPTVAPRLVALASRVAAADGNGLSERQDTMIAALERQLGVA